MKHFKMVFALVSSLIFTNVVIAENQRTRANPDVNIEVRSVEDIVNDSSVFTSRNLDDKAAEMSSTTSRVKNKTVTTTLTTGLVQSQSNIEEVVQSNKKDVVKKYNRFSNKQGEKKNKKNI